MHIWGLCPQVLVFWNQVFDIYDDMTGLRVGKTAELNLLSILPGSIASVKKSLLRFLLLVAWRLIPRYWKQQAIPTIQEWTREIIPLPRMGELTASLQDWVSAFGETWIQWDMFLDLGDKKRSLA